MSLYDTSSLEALLAQQEEEWAEAAAAKARRREQRQQLQQPPSPSSPSDGAPSPLADGDDDGDEEEEDGLQLSAHSSADNSDADADEGDEGDTSPQKKAAAGSSIAGGPIATGTYGPSFAPIPYPITAKQLVETAKFLKKRFDAIAAASRIDTPGPPPANNKVAKKGGEVSSGNNTQGGVSSSSPPPPLCTNNVVTNRIKGIAKLGKRLEKEVSMAEEALQKDEAMRRLRAEREGDGGSSASSPSPPSSSAVLVTTAAVPDNGRQPYDRCNSLLLYEMLLSCVENEKDVVAVLENEQIKDKSGPIWTRLSVDIDVVSQKGSRWVRVKAISLKNLEADFQGNSERKPFLTTAANFVTAAKSNKLPFGRHPKTVIMMSEFPSDAETVERLAGFRDAVRGALHYGRCSGGAATEGEEEEGEGEGARSSGMEEESADRCHDDDTNNSQTVSAGDGIDYIDTYFNKALVEEAMLQAELGHGIFDELEQSAWAVSLAPEAVEARMDAHANLWRLRARNAAADEAAAAKKVSINSASALKVSAPNATAHCAVLPNKIPCNAVPRLVNYDVTALVALSSDTCHAFDVRTAHALDPFVILRKQVDDEIKLRTLDVHIYPLLDRMTVPGAPRWWRHWDHGDALPFDGSTCDMCGPTTPPPTAISMGTADSSCGDSLLLSGAGGSSSAMMAMGANGPPSSPNGDAADADEEATIQQLMTYPFTHDKLVAYIDTVVGARHAMARRRRKGKGQGGGGSADDNPSPSSSSCCWPDGRKLSDVIWSPEQHAAERAKDEAFPYRLNWIMSEVAFVEFSWILRTISGPSELERAQRILKYVHVIPTEHFVHVEADPIFTTETETADERKERRKIDEKIQRAKAHEEQEARRLARREEQRLLNPQSLIHANTNAKGGGGGGGGLMKGVNRTCLVALDKAQRAATAAAAAAGTSRSLDQSSSSLPSGATGTAGGEEGEGGSGSSAITSPTAPLPAPSPPPPTLFDYLPSHVAGLECTGKVKARHKAVFGLGDALRAVTLTANDQFLKAAAEQFIRLEACVHCSRALVGKKVAAGLSRLRALQLEMEAGGGSLSAAGVVDPRDPSVVWK